MIDKKLAVCITILVLSGPAAFAAESISRWVDENGVTHFSNGQFAPANAEQITVDAANGMDVPAVVPSARQSSGPTWSKISMPPKQNPRGWRPKRESIYTGRRHQTNHRGH